MIKAMTVAVEPIVYFDRFKTWGIANRTADLESCNVPFWENEGFRGMRIWDANGREFKIVRAEKIKTIRPLLFYFGWVGASVKAKIELELVKELGFEEHKKEILNAFRKSSDFKSIFDGQGIFEEALEQETYDELIEVLRGRS